MGELSEISPGRVSALPDAWITEIFRRMELNFGSRFSNLWRNVTPAEMRTHWAEMLAGMHDRPLAIKAALETCQGKDDPPTPAQFLEHCRSFLRSQADKQHKQISPIEITPEAIEARAQQLAGIARKPDTYDYKLWAKRLREDYLSGAYLLPVQVAMASEALNEDWEKRECKPRAAA
ncbi:MAG: hypothetical protein NUV63_05700 [Gallionella sp.]|nr:hypothetical protein [Gallionella sp.]